MNEKKKILGWLGKNKLRNVQQVGRIMNVYYKRPKDVLDAAKKNLPLGKLV